ncbi:glycosyltransferase family 4 protein [Sphingomonas montana]|uniref:glycosyltransferase family 4 protein n=1 Tax=Sphingomonas montana TaxID=1843236 RepID=UPI00096C81AE|nr:glycosyltransferase family 1 protein [Sphingomonas montana]
MQPTELRVALFSGNYNYVRDGANQALNRLVGYLQRQGAQVRIYSPRTDRPAFASVGKVVNIPSVPFPGRGEYRLPLLISPHARADLKAFAPNMVHVASPEFVSHRAVTIARARGVPVVASVHTRFETYPRYYGLTFLEPAVAAILRRFYRRCDAIFAPSESMAQLLREQRMNYDVGIWSRGVDREIFTPDRRSMDWRRSLGLADDAVVIGFLGRLVMEKGLDVFSDTVDRLRRRGIAHRVLIVGEGPARAWFEQRLPDAIFTGQQTGADLGRALASMDLFFNPSVTETFGNVTLEAMAVGLPVVAARAIGSESLIDDGVSGRLIAPGGVEAFADTLATYVGDHALRRAAGAAGERASQRYTWDAVNQTLLDAYLRIAEHRRNGGKAPKGPLG